MSLLGLDAPELISLICCIPTATAHDCKWVLQCHAVQQRSAAGNYWLD